MPTEPTGFFAYDAENVQTFTPAAGNMVTVDTLTGITPLGSGVVSRFQAVQQCDWFALAFNDTGLPMKGHVRVYSPCAALTSDVILSTVDTDRIVACESPPCAATPGDFHPLRAFDVNGDGLNDLIVSLSDGTLHVAYSYGNGHFGHAPPPGIADDTFATTAYGNVVTGNVPLAMGDINGDGIPNIVDPNGVLLGSVGALGDVVFTTIVALPDAQQSWSEAVIADLDGDGFQDVAVGSGTATGITLYRGTGTDFFDPVNIVTAAPIKDLQYGDFDGDLVNDLIYATIGATVPGASAPEPDTVYISFGVRTGPPADPVAIGQVSGVSQIVPAYEEAIYPSLIRDAFVVGIDTVPNPSPPPATAVDTNVYLFPGDSSRQIEAPYFLLQSNSSVIDVPRRSVTGSFTGRSGLGDIAVFAKPQSCASTVCDTHLWVLPTETGSLIEAASSGDKLTPLPTALPSPFTTSVDAILANLGPTTTGSGVDQVVVLLGVIKGAVDSKKTAVFTATAAPGASGGYQFAFDSTTESDIEGFDITDGTLSTAVNGKALTTDVDGDGHLNLVVVSPAGGLAVVLGTATGALPSGSTLPALIIPYATLESYCSTTSSSSSGSSSSSSSSSSGTTLGGVKKPPMMPQTTAIGVAAFSPGDVNQGLVVVVNGGAVLVQWVDGQLSPSCLSGLDTGTAVAIADFDGDGIEDIMVSQSSGLNVYYGDSYAAGSSPTVDGGAP